jgi:UDP-glucose 4-epimerase
MGARVVVTGGAGFIGSELVRQLAAAGHRVIALDNLVNGRAENLDGVECRLERGDIRDGYLVARCLSGVDIVYHLACLGVRHSIHSPAENHEVNATATLALLAAARQARVGRFVYVSSSEVYGTARTVPMTEAHPAFPMTVYGAAKLAGECYARAYQRTYGFPTVVLRPFNAYGPRSHHEGDSGEVIPKFVLRAMAGRPLVVFGDGTQTRDFTEVSDTARGILAAGFAAGAVGETINVGSGLEITVNALADAVRTAVGRPVAVEHDPARPGDVLRLYADATLARAVLAFEPRLTLRAGLARLVEWYRASASAPEELLASEQRRNWEPRAAVR